MGGGAIAAWAYRPAGRYISDGGVSGVVRFEISDRGNYPRHRRHSLKGQAAQAAFLFRAGAERGRRVSLRGKILKMEVRGSQRGWGVSEHIDARRIRREWAVQPFL